MKIVLTSSQIVSLLECADDTSTFNMDLAISLLTNACWEK